MQFCFQSPVGVIRLTGDGSAISSIALNVNDECMESESCEIFDTAQKQLSEYFNGSRQTFDFPIKVLSGTDFQKSVWELLRKIPYGCVISYGEIAKMLGNPRACRAVGNAVGANPLPIVIPCHRVVAANGIGGFSGGLHIKKILMDIEGIKY